MVAYLSYTTRRVLARVPAHLLSVYHDRVPSLRNFKVVANVFEALANKCSLDCHKVDLRALFLTLFCCRTSGWAEGVLRLAAKRSLCETLVSDRGIESSLITPTVLTYLFTTGVVHSRPCRNWQWSLLI